MRTLIVLVLLVGFLYVWSNGGWSSSFLLDLLRHAAAVLSTIKF